MNDEPFGTNLVIEDEDDNEEAGSLAAGAEEQEAVTRKTRKPKTVSAPKLVKVVLQDSPEIPPTGLFIGHNGTGYILKAGVPAMVPEFLLEILDNAVMSVPVMDPDSLQVVDYRNRLRYPYQVMRT